MAKEKTKKSNEVKEEKSEKETQYRAEIPARYTRINNVFKGNGLHLTLENVTIAKGNMNKPFHSLEYDSYSSSLAVVLPDDIKKELYELLANSFSKESGLTIALKHFLEKKVTVNEKGENILYASVKWKEVNGSLVMTKPLKTSGVNGKFPYSFKGSVQIGFSYSNQHTFTIYLNGVVVDEVIQMEPEFNSLSTDSEFNPTISINDTIQEKSETQIPVERKEEKKETIFDKAKKKFW